MTITVGSFLMFLAIVQLILAAVSVPGLGRWQWFPGGMATWAISLFMTVAVR